jgi:hypothetical protein
LPHFPFVDQVAGAIRAQLEEHGVVASFELEIGSFDSSSDSEDFEGRDGSDAETEHEVCKNRRLERKRITKKGGRIAALRNSKSRTGTPSHRAESEAEPPDGHEHESDSERHDREKNEREQVDCRVLLALDVQINKHHLLDTIEWDLAPSQLSSSPPLPPHLVPSSIVSSLSPYQSQEVMDDPALPLPGVSAFPGSPEALARILCGDLGLHGEAVTLVAHALHEEILKHKKDAIEWGVLTAEPLSARARARNPFGPGPRPLVGVWRDWTEVPEFTPRLEVMSQEELERRELERERIARFVFPLSAPCFASTDLRLIVRRLRRDTSKYVKAAGVGRRKR